MREEVRGGTLSRARLYALDPSVRSLEGRLSLMSSSAMEFEGFLLCLMDSRNEFFLVIELLRSKLPFRLSEPCRLRDGCRLCARFVNSANDGSVSSRISDKGRVAVDQGGFVAVDQGGGARFSRASKLFIPELRKIGGKGGMKFGFVAKGCLLSSASCSWLCELYGTGGPLPGGGCAKSILPSAFRVFILSLHIGFCIHCYPAARCV